MMRQFLSIVLSGAIGFTQTASYPPSVAQGQSRGLPSVIHFCAQHCVTLLLTEGHYTTGQPGSNLWTVESFSAESVIIQRRDYAPYPLTAVISGKLSNDRNSIVGGTIVFNNSGQPVPIRAAWGTALNTVPGSDTPITYPPPLQTASTSGYNLPLELSECEANECGIWKFNGMHGVAQWPSGAIGNLTLERYGYDGVKIQRRDVSGHTPGIVATYTGTIDGGHLEGNVTWSWPGHWNRSPTSTWYAFITAPKNYTLLSPDLPCDSSFRGSPREAAERGADALRVRQYSLASCWLNIGVKGGVPEAQGMLSVFEYTGLDGPRNYPQAFSLAKQAAAANNYLGDRVLSFFYLYGRGVIAPDADMAKVWTSKADNDKAAAEAMEKTLLERQRVQAETLRKANQMARNAGQDWNVGGLLMVGLIVAAVVGAATSSGADSLSSDGDSSARARAEFEQSYYRQNQFHCEHRDYGACSAINMTPPPRPIE